MFITTLTDWFNSLWGAMQSDVSFVFILGLILIGAQLVNAVFGIQKSAVEGTKFSFKRFGASLLNEVWVTLATIGVVAMLYMLANLASMTLLPGFEVGDLPTLTILLTFGGMVVEKCLNIAGNLIVILTAKTEENTKEVEGD